MVRLVLLQVDMPQDLVLALVLEIVLALVLGLVEAFFVVDAEAFVAG